ncbi:MAG: sugar transferase [Lachnospira sp.]
MELRRWNDLPPKMRNREVRKYYNILRRHTGWLKVKRMLDVLVATIMLIVLAIPMAVIAVLIKLDSPGPVLFKQKRVTQYGRIFEIYKFRTMCDNASAMGAAVTTDNDSRITKIGAKLRKIRADEFPQVFNIIAGDMTLVGTRPEVPEYVRQYTDEMYATLLLPAGLTSRTSIAYKDEDKILGQAENPDKAYIEEVLPMKMKYNLESLRRFGIREESKVLWDTFASVVGSEKLTVKK